ncbi:glucose-6-phosphate isomerase [Methanohalophilus levihalophilus]|uniref:glucose-6-phosphate isomerase family protein n=1 Tax=Methanohalophilus levihalophilus TaxID=1431282 RepID=UPI001AE93AFA|nr:glucose-6-phosphate isomerase family protein [Methanohalophilus levihalophilus]MBP2030722.1 glucose-6-phosphate isomerase [Methanohalophilus levihalophilus]
MDNKITFGGKKHTPNVRMLSDMDEVVYDRKWLENAEDRELYYMYRDLYLTEDDHTVISEYDLRYDITIIPAGMLGDEYIKTAGHFHPVVPGTIIAYPEVYQVLEGEATYLLQHDDSTDVSDVVVIRASKGDIVVIPPDYGHITINASSEDLKMANWVCTSFSSIYRPIQEKAGAAYYLLKDGFVRNPSYNSAAEIRYVKPRELPEFGLVHGKDMYELVKDPEKLRFLTRPQEFMGSLSRLIS